MNNKPAPEAPPKFAKSRLGLRTILGLVLIEVIFCLLIFVAYRLSHPTSIGSVISTSQPKVTPLKTYSPMPPIQAFGRIAFVSNRDGNPEIYVMNADGTGQTRLTNSDGKLNNDFPAWSPDGQKIAFVSDRDENAEIYVMDADGNQQTQLTNDKVGDFHPTWSPDGEKIAFVSERDGNYQLCMMSSDGSNQTCLKNTELGDVYINLGMPNGMDSTHFDEIGISWSVDGRKLFYNSRRSGTSKIYMVDVTTGDQFDLTEISYDFDPQSSLDGQKIAFCAIPNSTYQISIMGSDGSNQRPITKWQDKTNSYAPAWSPDSQKLAFVTNRDGNEEIYVMNADGGYQTRLTDNQADDWNPSWTK